MAGEIEMVAEDAPEATDKPKLRCFVVGPIGEVNSTSRVHADWLLKGIILPTFEQHFPEFAVIRSDTISTPGMIDTQMINHLLEDELVIVDMSELNPNAFYEMGIRHMVPKPTVHMFREGTSLPFDVRPNRAIPFSVVQYDNLGAAQKELRAAVVEALSDGHVVDNPVTKARNYQHMRATATPAEATLLSQNADLERRLNMLEDQLNRVRAPLIGYGQGYGYGDGASLLSGPQHALSLKVPETIEWSVHVKFSEALSEQDFNISQSAARAALANWNRSSTINGRDLSMSLTVPTHSDIAAMVADALRGYHDIDGVWINGTKLFVG